MARSNHQYNSWSIKDVKTFYCRTFYSYFPYTILEWNKHDVQRRRSQSFLYFINLLLKMVDLQLNQLITCIIPLVQDFSAGKELHKFKHFPRYDLQSLGVNILSFSDNE